MLADADVDFIVVIAGVNDTAGHIGKDFYVHHMLNIITAINASNKYPIVVEVPEFGIEEKEAFLSTLKHGLYRYLFDGGKIDVISDYRNALKGVLSNTQLKYSLIPFDGVSSDYSSNTDIYSNAFHLNTKGNELFGAVIGESIVRLIKQ